MGYDSAHGQHHRHYFGRVERVEFESYEKLESQFEAQVRQYLETGTCYGTLPARVAVESIDSFFSRMKDNARELDGNKIVQPGFHLSFEDPADFLEIMTPARLRLLLHCHRRLVESSGISEAGVFEERRTRRYWFVTKAPFAGALVRKSVRALRVARLA